MRSVREDQFNKRVIAYADKLVLFGPRARGDFYRDSDIDLAAHGGNINRYGEAFLMYK